MSLEDVLNDPICQPVAERYKVWFEFMKENIEFGLLDSIQHTKEHCARVLLLALIIGDKFGLNDEEMDALSMASIFHDSRRIDDWLDQGHGKRAAEYYKDYCHEHNIPFDLKAYYIMSYHDQDDDLGLLEIEKSPDLKENCILLYKIFKDADGLDRLRLGPKALNINMLRTEEAVKRVGFAKYLLEKSRE